MTRRRISQLAAWTLGIAGLVFSAPSAKAEYFEYTSTISIDTTAGSFTPAFATIVNSTPTTSSFSTGINTVTLNALSSNPAPPHLNGVIGTDIVPLNIGAATVGVTNQNIAFNFTETVTITDFGSLTGVVPTGVGTLTFTGRIGGNIGDSAVNLDLLSFSPLTTTVVIGQAEYTVSFRNFASPGLDNDGRLTLRVKARAVPEPGSIALLGMGGVGFLGMVLRRRARVAA